MKSSRLFTVSALLVSFGWALGSGCSSSGNGSPAGAIGGGSSVGGNSQGGQTLLQPGGSSTGGSGTDNINPLCGIGVTAGTCYPDDESACRGYMPPGLMGGAGAGGEAASGMSGASGDGGMSGGGAPAGGAPDGAAGAAGGANQGGQDAGGIGGASGGAGGGAGGEGGGSDRPLGLAQYSCQVARESNQAIRQCVLAGTGTANAPCFSAADCAPSFACVTEGDAGRCLPYCCKPSTTCASGTYCADRPLLKAATDATSSEPPHVPVCVPADNCSLEDAFPCTDKSDCRCKGDTACMVVRDDGTTTCLKPGAGQQGDPCPCAWNHVCSSVTHQCVKICNTDPTKSDCGQQKCQASSELPPNFGVCVGPVK
jgi:hypothetical protein